MLAKIATPSHPISLFKFVKSKLEKYRGVEKTDGKLSLYTDKGIVIYYTESGDDFKDEFEIYELEIYEPIKC